MAAENRQQIRRVFMEVADLPETDRETALVQACGGDAVLRAEVEALLRADRDAGGFMGSPSAAIRDAGATITAAPTEQPGEMIGRYKLLQPIGEGGFGSVWMAEQREPVKRRVALKIIKLGMDTRQVIARFEAERQALAMMDHPNIAKVFDAGATETGRPYFVMEYIKGVPILEYCDTEKLDTKARLDLFVSVCHAIQHAHQKGIIHRDIKPSNVLVTMHDGVPVPKVIDFGIAKATNSELTQKTLFTEHRQMIGTPAYMSPEQAEMSGFDIDTRSDIYSLGVLLYELLTGTTPFDSEDLMSKGYAEMMRIIREVEPHKPSTRLSSLGDTGTRTAQQRNVGDVKKLGLIMRGDLDWIVMKCLEKDRTRRYETANGLAADIRRHLNDEAVTAGAPSAGYKLRKFVKRNRARVIAVGVVAGALVLGVIGTTGGLIWALNEKSKATLAAHSEAAAKVQAQENEKKAIVEATRAETITKFVITALQASDARNSRREGGAEGVGHDVTVLAAMDSAVKDISSGRFKDDPGTEADLRDTIGVILLSNGRYDRAKPLLEQALAMRERLYKGDDPIVATSLNNLATLYVDQGQYGEAEPLHQRALRVREKALGPDHLDVASSLHNLAALYRRQGHYTQAEPLYKRALAIREKALGPDHPDVATTLNSLAVLYEAEDQHVLAEALYTRALAISEKAVGPDHPLVATSLNNLAMLNRRQGQYAQAEPLYQRALAIYEKALGADHSDVASSLNNLAALYLHQGKYAQAEPLFTRALAIREKAFGPDHPDVATTLNSLAVLYKSQGEYAQAEPLYRRALAISEKAVGPDHPDAANILNSLAVLYQDRGKYAQAEPLFTRALAIREKALGPDHPDVATSLSSVANYLVEIRKYEQAEPLHQRALAIQEKAFGPDHSDVANSLHNLAVLYRHQGKYVQAEPLHLRALAIYERTFGPDHPKVAKALNSLAVLYQAHGRQSARAEPLYARALAIYEKAFGPDHADVLRTKGNLAALCWSQGKLDKSVPLFEEVLKAQEAKLGRQHPDTLTTVSNLGVNYKDAGRLAEAIPLLEEAYRASTRHPQLGWIRTPLLDAYIKAADPAEPESTTRITTLTQEMLAVARGTLPKDSPQLAAQLASFGQTLMTLKAWVEAESLIRECLAIREKAQPDAWTTFNTKSVLGAALLGQNKLAEAEPLLLGGYQGMKEREAAIPAQGSTRIPEALDRLVRLYEAKGNETEAAAWRSKLEAARAEQGKSDAKGDGR